MGVGSGEKLREEGCRVSFMKSACHYFAGLERKVRKSVGVRGLPRAKEYDHSKGKGDSACLKDHSCGLSVVVHIKHSCLWDSQDMSFVVSRVTSHCGVELCTPLGQCGPEQVAYSCWWRQSESS